MRIQTGEVIEKPAYRTIDAIRAIVAIAVVWNHCFNMMIRPVVPGDGEVYHLLAISASFGRDAVMKFFVISGYWITRSVTEKVRCGIWSWRQYLVNRLSRLWIVLLPVLVLRLVLDGTGRFLFDVPPYRALGFQNTDFIDVGTRLNLLVFLGNAAFLQDLAVPTLGSNGPLWSLSREFWYYVWFPTILLAAYWWFSVPAIIATLVTMFLSGIDTLLFLCWLAGSVVAWLDRPIEAAETPRFVLPRRLSILLGALIWVSCTILARTHGLDYHLGAFVIAAGFAVLLAIILRYDVGLPRIATRLTAFGAASSFSLYAYHMPVFVVIIAVVCVDHPLALSPLSVAMATCVCLLLIVGGAYFSRLTEANTKRLRICLQSTLPRWSRWSAKPRR